MGLLERTEQVAVVVDRFAQLDRQGQLVLISGEAGVGKSSLVRELLDHHLPGADVLVGRCDDLFAPAPSARWSTSPAAAPDRSPTPWRPATPAPSSTPSSPSWRDRRPP